MKFLIVDDDFTSRKVLQKVLSRYGECDIAVDGPEAIQAQRLALGDGTPYDLICLDIMMPGMDGHDVLRSIREEEERIGVRGFDGVKIVMTSALDDPENIRRAFLAQCEGYLTKPIDREKLLDLLRSLDLIPAGTAGA